MKTQARNTRMVAQAGYEKKGVPQKDAQRIAWATVNKLSGGGKKPGSGRKSRKK